MHLATVHLHLAKGAEYLLHALLLAGEDNDALQFHRLTIGAALRLETVLEDALQYLHLLRAIADER